MKTIGILLPCFNERDNICEISDDIINVFKEELPEYDYKIVFIDNASNDGTCDLLKELCKKNAKIAAIFNARNFNYYSSWYGIKNTPGDCVIQIPSDRQVPVSVIPDMVHSWEAGHDFVCGIKTSSKENKLMWIVRRGYYLFANYFSNVEENLNDLVATLYDRSLLDQCIEIDDPLMFRSLTVYMTKYSRSMDKVFVKQERRKKGKSKNKIKDLIRIGMLRIARNSTIIPFHIFMLGLKTIVATLVGLFIYILLCIVYSDFSFNLSSIISLISLVILGAFISLMGLMAEYIMDINDRVAGWPGVIERERINL